MVVFSDLDQGGSVAAEGVARSSVPIAAASRRHADAHAHDVLNDASKVVIDQNGDGVVNGDDLKVLGAASNIARVPLRIPVASP